MAEQTNPRLQAAVIAPSRTGSKFREPKRRAALVTVAISLVCLTRLSACQRPFEPANVILIVIDDLRADHLTPFGYLRDTSPFLNEVSERGVLFENTISQSSWTKTSMASLLTSLYPEAHGVRGVEDSLPDSAGTLPEVLKANGYRTYGIHGNPWLEQRFGFNQGYDEFLFTHWYKETFDARKVNEQVLSWLEEKTNTPFFLYIHYMDVHSPWRPPEPFDVFGSTALDLYDGSIFYLDSQIKALYAELEKRGLEGSTWFIVTSDHGEEFGEHGNQKWGHGVTLYGEVLRVPLIFQHPTEDAPGKRVSRQVRLVDIAPTILDLLGIPIPEEMEGASLREHIVVDGKGPADDLQAFSQVGLNDTAPDKDLIAVTTPEFKYILDLVSGSEELYDLRTDPEESLNILGANTNIAKTFRQKVVQFRKLQAEKRIDIVDHVELDEDLRKELRSLGYVK